jgi:hypothetical protein
MLSSIPPPPSKAPAPGGSRRPAGPSSPPSLEEYLRGIRENRAKSTSSAPPDLDEQAPRICSSCSVAAPPAVSDFTLIGQAWRLLQERDRHQNRQLKWFCPTCWSQRKRPQR